MLLSMPKKGVNYIMQGLNGQLSILSKSDISQIHQTSLDILKEIGIKMENEALLEMLEERGAIVDYTKQIVRIPKSMVEEAIEKAPSKVILYGREGKPDLHLEGKNVYTGTGGTAVNIFDLEQGERRASKARDVALTARLVDNLANIDFFVVPVYPDDREKLGADEARFLNALCYTGKHVMGGVYTARGIERVIDFAEEVAGSAAELRKRPIISMITSIISPLKMEKDYTKYMEYIISRGVPVVAPPAPIAGATSPLTLAGCLAQLNAEALFGIVLAQNIEAGAKVLYGIVPTTMDMRTSSFRFGSIESGLMNAAGAELAQYYNLPVYNTAGVTDSRTSDIQAGYEKMGGILLSGLVGANFIHDAAGLLDTGLTVAYEQYVIDNDILGMVKKIIAGIKVDEERLAFADIEETGPEGDFMTAATTLKFLRSEFYDQDIFVAERWEEWQKEGAKDGATRAKEIARDIIYNNKSKYIPESILDNYQGLDPVEVAEIE